MLQLSNVNFEYDRKILTDISFSLGEGEFLGIVGDSGVGKSTLLKLIGGLLDVSSGEIVFENKKVVGPNVLLIPGHPDIKLVNQDFDLDLYHSVRENIREKILYLSKEEREEMIDELLDLMELTSIQNNQAILLSGGEQQRLAFARALACEPKILLLDEPFAHLDYRLKNKLIRYLLDLKFIRKMSAIIVSHNGEEVLSLSDSIIHLSKGEMERKDIGSNFYFYPTNKEEALLFGEINELQVNGDEILFRPTAFQLMNFKNAIPVDVKFIGSQFAGAYCINYFTYNDEQFVLYSSKALTEVSTIFIEKQ